MLRSNDLLDTKLACATRYRSTRAIESLCNISDCHMRIGKQKLQLLVLIVSPARVSDRHIKPGESLLDGLSGES